jgi:hypothetical protein
MRSCVGYVAAVAFVAAAHTTVHAPQPTSDRAAIESAIKSTRAAGQTPLDASIYTARELDKQRQSSNAGRNGRFHRIALKITAPALNGGLEPATLPTASPPPAAVNDTSLDDFASCVSSG